MGKPYMQFLKCFTLDSLIEQKKIFGLFNFFKDNFNLMILWVQTHKELRCRKKKFGCCILDFSIEFNHITLL